MDLKIEYTDRLKKTHIKMMRGGYLVKFVEPKKEYSVSYTIDHSGKRVDGPAVLKGEDLTEPQIIDLFLREQL